MEIILQTALTLLRLPKRSKSFLHNQKSEIYHLLSTLGIERRSLLIQLSSLLPHQYSKGASGFRSTFTFACASCLVVLADTKKNYIASKRSISKKPVIIAKVIKWYHHTFLVLECYINKHNHNLSLANIAYMCLFRAAWKTARAMLLQQTDQRAIVHNYSIICILII